MSTPSTPETRRFSIRLPRPMWIGLAAVGLAIVAAVLRIGVPIWQQQVAIDEIGRAKGSIQIRKGGPLWLRDFAGDALMKPFDYVTVVDFNDTQNAVKLLVNILGKPIKLD